MQGTDDGWNPTHIMEYTSAVNWLARFQSSTVRHHTTSKNSQLAISHFRRKPYWNFKALSLIDPAVEPTCIPLGVNIIHGVRVWKTRRKRSELTELRKFISHPHSKSSKSFKRTSEGSGVLGEILHGNVRSANATQCKWSSLWQIMIKSTLAVTTSDMWLKSSCQRWPKTTSFYMSPCLRFNNSLPIRNEFSHLASPCLGLGGSQSPGRLQVSVSLPSLPLIRIMKSLEIQCTGRKW